MATRWCYFRGTFHYYFCREILHSSVVRKQLISLLSKAAKQSFKKKNTSKSLIFSAFCGTECQHITQSTTKSFHQIDWCMKHVRESHCFQTCLCITAEELTGGANSSWWVHAGEAPDENGVPRRRGGLCPLAIGCKGRWKNDKLGPVSCLCYWDLTGKRWKSFEDENFTSSQPYESSSELNSLAVFSHYGSQLMWISCTRKESGWSRSL